MILEYRRRLNEEEAAYFAAAVKDVAARAKAAAAAREEPPAESAPAPSQPAPREAEPHPAVLHAAPEPQPEPEPARARAPKPAAAIPAVQEGSNAGAAKRSFGDESVAVVGVEVLDAQGQPCAVFYAGDFLSIRITCRANVSTDRLNVGIRIRNKEGVKIYYLGHADQDMSAIAEGSGAPLFWSRAVSAGDVFTVQLDCACHLGANLYEVQAAVSHEDTPDYVSQRILHWVDEAAFFQVLVKRHEHFFGGGVTDLRMKAAW